MTPRLFLTSMSSDVSAENATEQLEPILPYIDGVVYVLQSVSPEAPSARYLETVKGAGRVVHRPYTTRHWQGMNDTLFTGLIEEGDLVLWVDALERAATPFVSRVKTEIGPMMTEADVGCLFYYGKAYLFPYRETLEYRNTPHWSLHGWGGRAIEWSQIEPDEKQVRINARPIKRGPGSGHHFCLHYSAYWVAQPAGSNTAALGIEQYARPGEDHNTAFARRETQRLAFRQELRRRGVPLTLDALKILLAGPMDDTLTAYVRGDKVLSDLYWYLRGRASELRDTHSPKDAIPIP